MCDCLKDAGYEPVPCATEQAVTLAIELPASVIVAALASVAVEQAPLYHALRSNPLTKNIPLIVFTGRSDATIRRQLGGNPPQVLFMPFKPEALVQAVGHALGAA